MNAARDRSLDTAPEGFPARGRAVTGPCLVLALIVMVVSIVSMGALVSWQIEKSVTAAKAASSTLLINNFMAPHLQEIASADALSPKSIDELNDAMQRSGVLAEVATFRIWKQDGRLTYSDEPALIGRQIPQSPDASKDIPVLPSPDAEPVAGPADSPGSPMLEYCPNPHLPLWI